MNLQNLSLYPLNGEKRDLLTSIISSLTSKIELFEEGGFHHRVIGMLPTLTEEERKKEYENINIELENLCLYHDVLEITASHENEWVQTEFVKRKREWKNEWDIPLDIFNKTIQEVTNMLKDYQEKAQEKHKTLYDEKVALLHSLRDFRNN